MREVASKYYSLISLSTTSVQSFSGNVFHNKGINGLRFYPNEWYPSTAAKLTDVKSFRNWQNEIFFQDTGNVSVDGGLFADNLMSIEIDRDCKNVTVTNAAISVFFYFYKKQVAQGGLTSHYPAYMPLIGIQLQSYLYRRNSIGFTFNNVQFSNFDNSTGCVGLRTIDVDTDPSDDHFNAYSKLSQLTYDASVNSPRVNLCGIVASRVPSFTQMYVYKLLTLRFFPIVNEMELTSRVNLCGIVTSRVPSFTQMYVYKLLTL
jgi:hypothetical protein